LIAVDVGYGRGDRSTEVIEHPELIGGGPPKQGPTGPSRPDDGERHQQPELSSARHESQRIPTILTYTT
jgi:hypothetical protein